MIFKCKNGGEIYYYTEDVLDDGDHGDFLLSDVSGILKHTNPDIKHVIYIKGFSTGSNNKLLYRKDYSEMLEEFVNSFGMYFIILRIGYDDSEPLTDLIRNTLIEQYGGICNAGFININSYTRLEHSMAFVYKSDISCKFINTIYRFEALYWLKPECTFEEIIDDPEYTNDTDDVATISAQDLRDAGQITARFRGVVDRMPSENENSDYENNDVIIYKCDHYIFFNNTWWKIKK